MSIAPEDIDICAGGVLPEGPAAPPIVQTAAFHFADFDALARGLADEFNHAVYTRGRNPTVEAFEEKIAALERAESAKAFASGMGAMSAIFYALLKRGDHVLFVNQIYGPVLQLAEHLERFGIANTRVAGGELAAVSAALRPETKLVWIENPGTMMFRLVDVAGAAALARVRGAISVVDNSWATPLFQKPLEMGVDIVAHSCSKYIGGHGDALGGVIAGSRALVEEVFHKGFMLGGATAPPFEAWLLNRSLATLPLRMRQHEADGLAVAEFLRTSKAVRRVHHPALAPEAAPLRRQLSGMSGLFSFELADDGFDNVRRVLNNLKRFRLAVSWGGAQSLAISPQRRDNAAALAEAGLPLGLIRLSVGLEGAAPLIEDLEAALA